jgi:DinB superfamily
MGKSDELARKFEQANNAVIGAVEGMDDAAWQASCKDDPRSAGVVAHHVASSHQPVAGVAQAIATGQPLPPITGEMIDQGNAQHAQQFAGVGKAETLDLLRSGGKAAAETIRGLSDEQLANTAHFAPAGGVVSAEQIIEMVLIGHPQGHLQSIVGGAG